MMTTTVIADDQPVLREGVRSLLAKASGVSAVGEAADAAALLALVTSVKPALVIVDLAIPGGGLDLLRRVAEASPATRAIVFSAHGTPAAAQQALRAGAAGYVLKRAGADEFVEAVRAAADGRQYVSPDLAGDVVGRDEAIDRYDSLTRREREIFKLSAEGLNNTQVGRHLGISPRTVETHRTSFMRKLGIKSQTDLIRLAIRRGIVSAD